MKKCLITMLPTNDLGLLTRSLPIAYELQRLGHKIAFCNPGKSPNKVILDAGFENLQLKWPLYYIMSGDTSFQSFSRLFRSKHLRKNLSILFRFGRHASQNSTAEIWNIDHFLYMMGLWNEHSVRAAVDDLMELIKEYDPDLILDFWNPFACLAARACHKPIITVIQADMHPLSKGFIWWKDHPDEIPSPVNTINTILDEHQLQPIKQAGELFIGDKTLVIGIPETDPLPDSADVTYIGSILWQKPNEELPESIENLNNDKPLVWVYPGNPQYINRSKSPFDSLVVLQTCIEALKDMLIQVVLTTGHHSLPKSTLPLPANFLSMSYVPGLAMAKRSDLMIHHGGYGSCQTSLYTGTPTVVIPTFSERESNARRLAAAGAGEYILPNSDSSGKKKQLDAKELQEKVNHVLSNPSYIDNCKRVSNKLQNYGGADYAANLIAKE